MQIDPGTLLRQLTADFQLAGGKYVVRNFADRAEVLALQETVIFNCTGLGAAALFKDSSLVPIKGQLVYLPPDPAVDYMTFGGGFSGDHGFLHMFPRADVILLGGTYSLMTTVEMSKPKKRSELCRSIKSCSTRSAEIVGSEWSTSNLPYRPAASGRNLTVCFRPEAVIRRHRLVPT